MDLLTNEKDIILMADGKLVTKGLKENFCGDVNLFGHETDPNISELEDGINRHLEFVSKCIVNFKTSDEVEKYELIQDLTNCISVIIGKIRKFVSCEQKKLRSYTKSVFSEQKYQKVISSCKTNIYTSAIWLKKTLRTNVKLMKLMSNVQLNNHLFASSTQRHLSEGYNIRLLHEADYVMMKVDPVEYPHLIKYSSEMFQDLRRQSLLTSTTIYNALGLFSSKAMKLHFCNFIQEIGQDDMDESDRYAGICSLINILMPALLPSCAVLYEEGCRFIDGKVRKKILCSDNHWIIRHHHTTRQKHYKCNHVLDMEYDNIAVITKCIGNEVSHTISRNDALRALTTMRIANCLKCWFLAVATHSVVLIEMTFRMSAWKEMWKRIAVHFDTLKPHCPKKVGDMKKELYGILDTYINSNSKCLVEIPRLNDVHGSLRIGDKFSPYNMLALPVRSENTVLIDDSFEGLCYEASDLIEEGYNFLCVEASEILAFVATNSSRVIQPGIPQHLPIAYGMRGHSFPMETMRNMVNDIRNDLKDRNTSVLCEVYDGQFHKLNVRSENGNPLTRIQHRHDHFKEIMSSHERLELVQKILPYAQITEDDLDQINTMQFEDNTKWELNSVTLSFHTYCITVDEEVIKFRQMCIETNPVGGYSMGNIVTHSNSKLWQMYKRKHDYSSGVSKKQETLTTTEMQNLITGSKYKRRNSRRPNVSYIEDSDSESDDPDYFPDISDSESGSENSDAELSAVEESQLMNITVASTGQSCIKRILLELKKLDNKHNWKSHSIDSFLKTYLSNKASIGKLFLYEMDIINSQVKSTFSKELFKKGDTKSVRIDKISRQLKKIPQLFEYSSSEEDADNLNPDKLQDIVKALILSRKYPKDFLAAPICEITHDESVARWEQKSTVPIKMYLPFVDEHHIIFNYPEISVEQKQIEMRTFDYTHILNNLRFHISNSGFDHVRTEAFLQVSEIDHDIVPKTIVELKMDRQNCSISQRFFSADVQKILTQLGYRQEAEFVELVRMWFRACDERGMPVNDRLIHLHKMYEHLVSLLQFSHYPPNKIHVAGIPI